MAVDQVDLPAALARIAEHRGDRVALDRAAAGGLIGCGPMPQTPTIHAARWVADSTSPPTPVEFSP
jgi:hypothetical protein